MLLNWYEISGVKICQCGMIAAWDSLDGWFCPGCKSEKKGGEIEVTKLEINFTKTVEDGENIHGSVEMNVPETTEEAAKIYGEDVVYGLMLAALKVDAQRICRAAETVEGAQAAISEWVPGVKRARVGGVSEDALVARLQKLSPDKLASILAKAGITT